MALPLATSFDGGTDTTALTSGSGGNTATSGSYLDVVSAGTGATCAFSAGTGAHGSMSCKCATGATSTTSYVAWNTSFGTQTTHYGRLYFTVSTLTGLTQGPLVAFKTGSGSWNGCIQLMSTGYLRLQLPSYATGWQSAALSATTTYRLEWKLVNSTTVGGLSVSYYLGDSTTAVETYTASLNQNWGANTTGVWAGWCVAGANQPALYLDDFALSGTGWVGPSGVTVTPSALAVTTSIPAPAVLCGSAAAPAALACSSSFPAPQVRQDQTVTPATLTVATTIPVPAVAIPVNALVTPATLTVTTRIPVPFVSPATISHVGDGALYSGYDSSPVVSYSNTAGNTLVAYITVYNSGNHPGHVTGVFDDVGNTWSIAAGGGSYNAGAGQYGYTAVACCVGAAPMSYITVYYSEILNLDHSVVQISEFAGVPAGSTPVDVQAAAPNTAYTSYTAPTVTVPLDGVYLILSAVASTGAWSGTSPGTALLGTHASWNSVTAAGGYAPTLTGSSQTVHSAVTVAIGFATPDTIPPFTPVGGWQAANSASLAASYQQAGNLLVVKVINTADSTVYCTGLTCGGMAWDQAGVPFLGSVNAMTAVAFLGMIITPGADTITPTWSGTTPASWSIAAHEFSAASGWAFGTQGGLDSAGTGAWPALTPGSGAGELYIGHATAGVPAAGSTPGYVYAHNVASVAAYNASAPDSATNPAWTDTTQQFGLALLIMAASSVEAGGAAWAGSSTTTRTNVVTSASFTPAANSLLVVCTGCGNYSGATQTGVTVTGSAGGSWTQLVRGTVAASGDASVWVKDAGSSPPSQTVTVTMAPSTVRDVGLIVRQFTGAAPAAAQTGAHNTASGTVATVSVTPTVTGSQVVGAWGNANTTAAIPNAATTLYGQTVDSGGVAEGALEASALATAGVPQVLGYTVAKAGSVLAVAEILPAAGSVPLPDLAMVPRIAA